MFGELFSRKGSQGGLPISWNELKDVGQIENIVEESKSLPVLIFKHSYRCGTSAMALDRLHRNWDRQETEGLKPYFLDLITYREVSNQITDIFGVWHQSPQVLLIHGGKCIYHNSHMGISYQEIKSRFAELATA